MTLERSGDHDAYLNELQRERHKLTQEKNTFTPIDSPVHRRSKTSLSTTPHHENTFEDDNIFF